MAKFARIVNNIAVEICDDAALATFNSTVAGQFTACPDSIVTGSTLTGSTWTPPTPVTTTTSYPQVTPPKFYWLFTAEEQVQIETLKLSDPMIQLFFKRLDDPRLNAVDMGLQSVQDAIKYVLNKIHVGGYAGRFEEIMTGELR